MRNQWGAEQYEDPRNDNDSKWTPKLKQQAGRVQADDGIFYMPVADFHHAFVGYDILMYADWKVSEMTRKNAEKRFDFYLTSPVDQEVVFTLDYQLPIWYNIIVDNGT